MSTICDSLLATAIKTQCPNVKGFEAEAVLINRADIDWDKVVKDTTYPNVFSAVPLISGKTGYQCVQFAKDAFTGTKTDLNAGTYKNDFTETLSFRIFSAGVLGAQAATEIANATLVAVVKQKQTDADDSNVKPIYRIYGLTGDGLQATEMSNEPNSDDGNIWAVTCASTGSNMAAAYLWDTDVATTDAKFKAYTA